MIVYGTRDFTQDLTGAPTVDLDQREPVEFQGGSILQVLSELTFQNFEQRVPPALHPTHPPFCSMLFYSVPESELGGFTMAIVGVSSLAGISRFGYIVNGWIDNEEVGAVLGSRFGYRLAPASVAITRRHDRVWGRVVADGDVVLEAGLVDPEPVSGQDANHAGHLNLALVSTGEEPAAPMLVQTGPQLSFRRCDRGTPQVSDFDAAIVGCDAPYWPMSAFTGSCDLRFGPVDFVCDPSAPAVERRLAGTLRSVL